MKLLKNLILSNIRRVKRNRGLLFATLFFPLIFIGVFGIAFQTGQITTSPVRIAIIQNDLGIPSNSIMFNHSMNIIENDDLQSGFISILSGLTYEDNKTKLFDVEIIDLEDEDEAMKSIEQGKMSGLLHIPTDFSLALMASFRSQFEQIQSFVNTTNQWESYPSTDYRTTIDLIGDQTLQGFGIASSVISQLTSIYFDFTNLPENYQLDIDGSINTDELTAFDFVLPGLVIFGIMQTLGVVASTALNDVESGLLGRLRISSMSNSEYIISLIISQLLISILQIPIFFGVATVFGFPLSSQILIAFVFAILVSLSMTGIGLIIAATVSTTDSANTIAGMISTPMAFLAGAFFTVPNPIIIPNIFDGNSLGLMDLLPPTTAIQGLRLVLIGGRGIQDVIFHLVVLGSLTILLLIMGLLLYSRRHFKAIV